MTLAVQVPSTTKVFTGPGEYTFSNFLAYSADTITAYHRSATGLETRLVYGTDYTATLNVGTIGGHIDVTTSAYTGGFIIIGRELPFAQEVDLIGAGRFDPETLERALDEAAMRDQQLQASVDLFLSTSHWRTDWVTGTVYYTNDIVQFTDLSFYVCTEAHTSGTFATDLAAGKWTLIIDVAFINQLTSEASSAAIEATTQAGIATTQASNASTSATTASTQAGIATTQAGIATTQAGIATTQAGIATTKAAEAAASALEAAGLVLVGERSDAIYPDYYVATAGQTAFTITHPTAKENILVFMNSRKLRITDDYTLNSDTAASVLTLTTAAAGGEELDIISINTYDLTGSAADMANLVSQATTQATNAANSATAAGNSATAAAGSASTASTQATNAANSASAAATSATNSANSATASAGSASTATAQATASANSATASANSATAAAGSATAADGSADAAAASALVAEGHADDAAVSATEAAAATSLLNKKIAILQNELLDRCMPAVAKILATTANLVDVLIYNTYDDYDGGAWTENAHTQSWYTEQLNTATRGSKREFPKVALIVAETTKVTIYDATETGCPMWMVFNGISASWSTTAPLINNNAIKGVAALNGKIGVCGTAYGLYVVDFPADAGYGYRSTPSQGKGTFNGNISKRDSQLGYTTTIATTQVVNDACNDVAMTQISRTENAYGLLDPVIAVATDGGVSVIDGPAGVGTVVDSNSTQAFKGVDIRGDGRLVIHRGSSNGYIYVSTLPVTDFTADGFIVDARVYYQSTIPAGWNVSSASTAIVGCVDSCTATGKALGLSLLSEDTTTPANGMVSYITNSYNTGWLKGDIRRALICEAEGATETLTNLVTNGTFDSDTTGWTAYQSTLSVDSGRLKITNTDAYGRAYQAITTVPGKEYTISVDCTTAGSATCTVTVRAESFSSGTVLLSQATIPSQKVEKTFTATSTTTYIIVQTQSSSVGQYTFYDNIVVTSAVPDRSVKASALTVNGSLTRSPVATGAELQAISWFSTSNFLSQAYSADLDFGTGDFYICGWLKNTNDGRIFNRVDNNADAHRILVDVSSGKLRFIVTEAAGVNAILISSLSAITGTWMFFVAGRFSGNLVLYINKAPDATPVSNTYNLSSSIAISGVGIDPRTIGSALTQGSIALLRIGAGSLSESQIAKMYHDELAMFQGNAKCTIQGASSAVTALAWNERYQKLLVGTSAGVTTFDGLVVDQDFYSSTRSIKALASAGKAVAEANTIDMRWDVDNQEFAAYSPKTMATPEGGLAVLMTNKTGAASVKGYIVSPDTTVDNAVRLTPVGQPDCIGVCYEDGVADGAEMWVVVSGIADVYFSQSATRGHYARTGFTDDTGEVAGQAVSEAVPSSPLATDKHFAEIGHVLASRSGAGITKCVLHFN